MKKTLKSLLITLSVLFLLIPTTVLAENSNRIEDQAQLLTAEEEADLEDLMQQIYEGLQFEVVVLTTYDTQGKSDRLFAADFWDDNGYGYGSNHDGIILIVNMSTRDYQLVTTGRAEDAFTNSAMDYILDYIYEDMRSGNYHDAFEDYAALAYQQVREYDESPKPGSMAYTLQQAMYVIPKTFVAAVVIAVIVVVILASKNKTVRHQAYAFNYSVPGSFKLFEQFEFFLFRNVTRRRIERDHDSHGGGGGHGSSFHSSSGGSHSSSSSRHF